MARRLSLMRGESFEGAQSFSTEFGLKSEDFLVCHRGDDAPSISKDMDMVMLTFPGGQERTEAQFRSLLKASGFELKSITPTTTMVSVVVGRPADTLD